MTVARRTTITVALVALFTAAAVTPMVTAMDGAAGDGASVHKATQSDAEVRDYWTPERMAEAKPAMPVMDPDYSTETVEQPEGDPGDVQGEPGQ